MERILREIKSWGFDTEQQAKNFVEELNKECSGDITKHSIERKTKKSKGEIVAECYQLTVQIDYQKIFDYLVDDFGGEDE